jgi:hypothetical protein
MRPLFFLAVYAVSAQEQQLTWKFDRIDEIAGHKTTVVGNPRVIDTHKGKAIEFGGSGDALFLDVHPLAGAKTFTWEVIFRPDGDGRPEQRFFHMHQNGTSNNRLLFETRLINGKWCLDSYAKSDVGAQTLIDRAKLHPVDQWMHAAMVYDGREFRHYVNGELQGKAEVNLTPHGEGRTSIGVRINKIDWFKGAIRLSRITRNRALDPAEFLKP